MRLVKGKIKGMKEITFNMEEVLKILDSQNIAYQIVEHKAVYTVAEADAVAERVDGAQCKNLFLRNGKGKKYFLVIAEAHEKVDLAELGKQIGERLSFASPERLKKYLALEPGAVSAFGIINDEHAVVEVYVSKTLLGYDKVSFHPNVNTATLVLNTKDMLRFFDNAKNKVEYVNI